jgi:cytoskeleton protein RodZ
MLAQMRGASNLSVVDVAKRLKYSVRQIEALEAEEFALLRGNTIVRGMVRSYSKLLGIDPHPVLKALERRYIPEEISVDLRNRGVPFPQGGKRGTRIYLALSLLVLFAVAALLYEWQLGALPWKTVPIGMQVVPPSGTRAAVPPRETPAETPAVAPAEVPASNAVVPDTAPSPQAGQGEGHVRLEFAGESWVEITDKGGAMLLSQLNPRGTRITVTGRPPLSLVIGNASSVRLTYNENPVDLRPYARSEVARLTLN